MGNNVAIGGAEWPMNWEMLYDKIIANEMMELEYVVGLFRTTTHSSKIMTSPMKWGSSGIG